MSFAVSKQNFINPSKGLRGVSRVKSAHLHTPLLTIFFGNEETEQKNRHQW